MSFQRTFSKKRVHHTPNKWFRKKNTIHSVQYLFLFIWIRTTISRVCATIFLNFYVFGHRLAPAAFPNTIFTKWQSVSLVTFRLNVLDTSLHSALGRPRPRSLLFISFLLPENFNTIKSALNYDCLLTNGVWPLSQ